MTMKKNSNCFLHVMICLAVCLTGTFRCFGQTPGLSSDLAVFPADPERHLNSIAFGNGVFVAVGYSRIILVSDDGTNWLEGSDVPESDGIGVNFSTQYYTARGESLTLVIPNEETTQNQVPSKPFQFRAVGFGNGKFVIVGDSGEIHYSSNGRNWRLASTPVSPNLNGVVCSDLGFVAVGDDGVILTSPDAVNWSHQNSGTTNRLYAVAYGSQRFAAVGGNKNESMLLSSTDGVKWVPIGENHGCPLVGVAFGNNQFVVSAGYGYGLTMVSADGEVWREVSSLGSWSAIAFGGDRFITVDSSGHPISSRDGSRWEPPWIERHQGDFGIFSGSYAAQSYAACGNGVYVMVEGGYTGVSKDAIHWHLNKWPQSKILHGWIKRDHIYGPFYDTRGYKGPPVKSEPLRSHNGQDWRTFAGVPVPGNVGGSQTRLLERGTADEYAVLYSEDGIKWIRLRPTTSSQSKLVARTVAPSNPGSPSTNQESSINIFFELNGRSYQLSLPARIGQIYQLQASTDLEHWESLTILTNRGTAFSFSDQDAAKFPQRFYRLKPQP
jgi:hypothetical protein